jgi:diguanylate cyclase (GGDEF)-like protein/PAS domain S-box-containing protein
LLKIILIFFIAFSSLFANTKEIKLQLKWKHQFQFAGYYAALHKGFYKEAGLDKVVIQEASYHMNMTQEILSNNAHFGVGTSGLVLDFANKKPIVVLGVIFQHSPLAIMTLKNNIRTIHDLVGKKVMIEDGSADIYALLKREQIPLESLNIIPHDFNPQSLIHNEIDAMSVYSTDEPFALENQNIQYNIFFPNEAGIDFYGDNLFTSQDMINQNPQTVEAFRKASFLGWQYALAYPDEIIDIILEHYNTQNKTRENYEFEAKQMIKYLIYPDILEVGYMHKGRWEHIVKIYQELGFLDEKINLDKFLYTSKGSFFEQYKNEIMIFLFFTSLLGIASYIIYYIYKINKNLKESEQRHKILFQNSASAGIVWKKGYIITDWNKQATKLFGWSANEVIGRNFIEYLVPQTDQAELLANINNISNDQNLYIFTNKNILKNGSIISCEWHNTLLQSCDESGDFEVVSLAIDITKRLEEEQTLKQKANFDFLTNLPNRSYFEYVLNKTYSLAKRSNTSFGLAFIDFDGFKAINDTYGHHAGDVLLKELAQRFQATIRQEDTIARIGGDEFALIFHMKDSQELYQNIINRILQLSVMPVIYTDNINLQVSASIGISFYSPQNKVEIQELISQADKAMYEAKGNGKNCFCVYHT